MPDWSHGSQTWRNRFDALAEMKSRLAGNFPKRLADIGYHSPFGHLNWRSDSMLRGFVTVEEVNSYETSRPNTTKLTFSVLPI